MSNQNRQSNEELLLEIKRLKAELELLKKKAPGSEKFSNTVKVPAPFAPLFKKAEKTVGSYFSTFDQDPSKGSIDINDERYVLIRASALSYDFFNGFKKFYADQDEQESTSIASNMLFDLAHLIGLQDARNFHYRMDLHDPISKLSAGPVHFAYSGWAFVEILPESDPQPNENFFLKYNHPYSFEAESWLRSGKKSETPVCIMNAGYSSGWCEESFGIPLTAVEISCKARGDKECTFIMAPPSKISGYLNKNTGKTSGPKPKVPSFLERKQIEETLRKNLFEKEMLIKEVHHRVKNNLQIVSSLLNLQSETLSDSSSREKFHESIGRIRSIAMIHELLYKSKNLSEIDVQEYFSNLVSHIKATYINNKKIKLDLSINAASTFIDIDKAIPCGLIVNELLSNALKHAFKERDEGKVKVSFTEKRSAGKKGNYVLKISDNGSGFQKPLDIQRSETLGLQLVNSLVAQLDGSMKMDFSGGTAFEIVFS